MNIARIIMYLSMLVIAIAIAVRAYRSKPSWKLVALYWALLTVTILLNSMGE